MILWAYQQRHLIAYSLFALLTIVGIARVESTQDDLANYARENRALIRTLEAQGREIKRQTQALADSRRQARANFRRSDFSLCREIEQLKLQNREDAQQSYDRLDETLAILNLERTAEVEAVARRNLAEDLERNAPRPGGCGELPSSR